MIKPFSYWILIVLFVILQYAMTLLSGSLLTPFMNEFQLTNSTSSMIISSYYYLYIVCQIPSGVLIDRYGIKKIVIPSLLFFSISSFWFSATKSIHGLLLSRITMGLSASVAFIACTYIISKHFKKQSYTFMIALTETCSMLTVGLISHYFSGVMSQSSWRHPFHYSGIIALCLSALIYIFYQKPKRLFSQEKHYSLNGIQYASRLKVVLSNKKIWFCGLYAGIMFGVLTSFAGMWYHPLLIAKYPNFQNLDVYSTLIFIGVSIGGPIIGILCRYINESKLLYLYSGCSTLLLMVMIWIPINNHIALAIISILLGMFLVSFVLPFKIADGEVEESLSTAGSGITNMLCVLLSPFIQPIVGFMIDFLTNRMHSALTANQIANSLFPLIVICTFFVIKHMKKCK
ncbi:MFS transporter [Gammaproteobacteria bacterium]|nr:MFS transporter [Gammaproteobacteria bacterium]